jgi:predicted nucleic acid-binding protein
MAEQVIDASVAIKWIVKDESFRDKARYLLRDARLNGIVLCGPPLLEYEVESAIQYRLFHGRSTIAAANTSLYAFHSVGVRIFTHPDMVSCAREIARKSNQERIYDSIYAALAQFRGCEFWTADKAFYDAVKSTLSFVKYLPDYH